jgi:glycosyltransferase involved in cell wall biosynthesis
VFICRYDRVLEGIRARARVLFIRQQLIHDAQNQWKGKRILIVLPIIDPAGGAYVVIQERRAMLEMGVYACLLNLITHKEQFGINYPDLEFPVIYAKPDEIGSIAKKFDAVIATLNISVEWLESIIRKDGIPLRGYYIQDFEPHFYMEGSKEFKKAWESYTKFPDLVRITKTRWNEEIVKEKTGVNCQIVGPSVDIDLFRPKQRIKIDPQNRPVYIGAMIRPSTPRRGSLLTMNILCEVWKRNKNKVKIITFGCEKNELETLIFPKDFNFHHVDIAITRKELASLLNEIDIFVDFSSYQAMGLTALEAMACGATVIVPQAGGSNTFVRHELNGLVVDTSSEKTCLEALNRLVMDDEFRIKLGRQALKDACEFPPEKAAYNTLMALFK